MMRRFFCLIGVLSAFGGMPKVYAETPYVPSRAWSFEGIRGTFDRAALQRGLQVYKEVCSACHSLSRVRYRDLTALGYSAAQVKAFAAEARVIDAQPDMMGMPVERAGKPSDAFPAPYPTEEAARQANQGALPPDLSLITKARAGGANYVYALLTGYTAKPDDVTLQNGLHYNRAFPGHQIAMAQPLTADQVTYQDGTKATLEQMAEDVVTFLAWAAEPETEQRKRMGVKVILYLLMMTAILWMVMRRTWARLKPDYHQKDTPL